MAREETHIAAVAPAPGRPLISWGAVFAGLVFVLAAGWLLFTLGSALGVSIADAADTSAISQGFGVAAAIWLIATWIAVFFLGGMLVGRLAGRPDPGSGLMHGVTLWSAGIAVTLVLGYWGIRGMIETGQSVIGGVASAVTGTAETVGGAAGALEGSPVVAQIQEALRREAAQVVAQSDTGQAQVGQGEAEQAIRQVDSQTLSEVAVALARGDEAAARQRLAAATNLSESQIDSVMQGLSARAEAEGEELQEDSPVVQQLAGEIQQRLNQASERVAEAAGPQVTQQEVERAVQQLEPSTLASAAQHIVMGRTEQAKTVIANNTDLSREDVDAIVTGVEQEAQQEISQLRQDLDRAAEAASSYAQGVLWTVVIAAALGLLAAIGGGWVGAGSVRRVYGYAVQREIPV